MLIKIILILLGITLVGVAINGIIKGKIFMKGLTAIKKDNPAQFWLCIIVYLAFGAMLFFFGLLGRIGK